MYGTLRPLAVHTIAIFIVSVPEYVGIYPPGLGLGCER